MASWYEKWCKKNNEKAKKDYVTISRLEFLDTISSTIADLDANLEEAHSLSIFGAIVAEKIFDKQETKEEKNEKADDRRVCKGNAQQKGEVMTNKEENEKRFDELGIGDLPASEIARHIAVRKNGDVDLCSLILCHDCIFTCRHCVEEAEEWLADEAEPDEPTPEKEEEKVKKEVKKEELKVGDTVKARTTRMREGKIGTVKSIVQRRNGSKIYSVQLNGDGYGSTFLEHEIEKVKPKKTPPRIVVYRDGDTVTARDLETGETASAVCSKKDTFDIHTGAFIAMARLTHFMDDIRMMRLEAEQIEGDIADMKMRFGALM